MGEKGWGGRGIRSYGEYFGRCVANRTPGAYQACDGVQLK